jgi:hypothetical protein
MQNAGISGLRTDNGDPQFFRKWRKKACQSGVTVHPFLSGALFFLFFACSFISAIFLFLAMLFADLYCSYSDCWHGIILRCLGACLRHDYWWIWVPAVRILLAITILHCLRAHALSEQTA